MKFKTKPDRSKTLTVKITAKEHQMLQVLRSSKVDYPQMVRDLIHDLHNTIKESL